MASKKKQSEGIALLSMYDDDEEDDEYEDDKQMIDIPSIPTNQEQESESEQEDYNSKISQTTPSIPIQSQNSIPTEEDEEEDRVSTPFYSPSPSQLPPPPPPPQARKSALAIVDYAHDETAMSPEPEDGEITGFGDDPQSTNDDFQGISPPGTAHTFTPNIRGTPQPSEYPERVLSDNSAMETFVSMETETTVFEETVTVSVEIQRDEDPLDKFLPPPPETKCSVELQKKINKFLELKKLGKSFNAEVRNRKDYRNPDFLLHAVRYQEIDHIGSCFSKDVFDPHGYDKSDFYDELEADMKREMERKEQERKKSQRLDFVPGGTQAVGAPASQRNTIQNPVSTAPTAASVGFHSHPIPADSVARDSRQNKKSKWDKVDGDRKNPLPIGGQDALPTAAAHAALLSAAQVGGAGYTLYAQQKRKEAEEKRYSEKRRSRS